MDNTKIEWADATWSPITGCSVVSPGCTNCYAQRLAGTRMRHHWSREGLTQNSQAGPVWNGEVRFNRPWLDQPLRWKSPRRIFVCAHGDLFHEGVPVEWIDQVFAVMQRSPRHIFQVLTKRAARMKDYVTALYADAGGNDQRWFDRGFCWPLGNAEEMSVGNVVPFKNVWLGVSCEDQRRTDERIPELLATPAAVRWISAEPLLGPVDLTSGQEWLWRYDERGRREPMRGWPDQPGRRAGGINWVVVGGESGPGARPMLTSWAKSIRDQCVAAGVPYFFKQWGEWIDADHRLANLRRAGFQITHPDSGYLWEPTSPLNFGEARSLAEIIGDRYEHHSDGTTMIRVGKRAAGRLLDSREWSGYPA